MAEAAFQNDPRISDIASAYALDAVDLAARNFRTTLDWSEESVRQVEKMLSRLHDEFGKKRPPEDTIWTFAKAFGSYVGEVLRRHYGGEWGMVQLDGEPFPGLKQTGGALCWPWGRCITGLSTGRRITFGTITVRWLESCPNFNCIWRLPTAREAQLGAVSACCHACQSARNTLTSMFRPTLRMARTRGWRG